jgi:hypothetical protein
MPSDTGPPPWEEPKLISATRKYAWDYFAVHASQRLTTFQFYVTLSTAMTGGYILLLRNTGGFKWMALIGLLIFIFSITFWQLDKRNRELVKNGENALKYLDSLLELQEPIRGTHALRLFDRDDRKRVEQKSYLSQLSYSQCFNIIFGSFALLGLLLFAQAILSLPLTSHITEGQDKTTQNSAPDENSNFIKIDIHLLLPQNYNWPGTTGYQKNEPQRRDSKQTKSTRNEQRRN